MVIHMNHGGKPLCGNIKATKPENLTEDSKKVTCRNCKRMIKAAVAKASKKE